MDCRIEKQHMIAHELPGIDQGHCPDRGARVTKPVLAKIRSQTLKYQIQKAVMPIVDRQPKLADNRHGKDNRNEKAFLKIVCI